MKPVQVLLILLCAQGLLFAAVRCLRLERTARQRKDKSS
jgi:hypothetical protein